MSEFSKAMFFLTNASTHSLNRLAFRPCSLAESRHSS
jgi:hypothetical protein